MCIGRLMNFDPSISARRRTAGPRSRVTSDTSSTATATATTSQTARAPRTAATTDRRSARRTACPTTPRPPAPPRRPPTAPRSPPPTRRGRRGRRGARSPSSWLRRRPGPDGRPPESPGATSTRTTLPGIGATIRCGPPTASPGPARRRPTPAEAVLPRRHTRPLMWTSTSPAARPGTTTARTLWTGGPAPTGATSNDNVWWSIGAACTSTRRCHRQ